MDTMIQQLVEAERLRMGLVKLAPQPIGLGELLCEVQAQSRPACAPHPIRLALPEAPVVISVDRPRLGQALTSLLRLTAQAADGPSEVTVEAAAQNGEVACTIHAPRPAALGARPAEAPPGGAPPVADLGIAFHTARILIECHGGSLRVMTDAPQRVGFAVALPATSART
jgi:signal transduction histidine kinase